MSTSSMKEEDGNEGKSLLHSFEFTETFLVLTVHEDWAGTGGGMEKTGSGIFYVRNHMERWRKIGG